jgi:hypothetical protein
MHTKNELSAVKSKKASAATKVLMGILILLAVGFLLLFFILPAYLSSDAGKSFVVDKINSSIDGQVTIKGLSMSWFKGISLDELSFIDNAGRITVNVRQIKTKPLYMSLLRGNIAFGKTLIDAPDVILSIADAVKSDIAKADVIKADKPSPPAIPAPAAKEKQIAGLERIDLEVRGGNVTINQPTRGMELQIRNIESKVDLKPAGSKSTFDVSMDVAEGDNLSKITAKGNLQPSAKKSWTLKGTSGDFEVKIDDLDLRSLSPLFALAGKDIDASGKLNADLTANIDDGDFKQLAVKAVLSEFGKEIDGKMTVLDKPIEVEANISSENKSIKIDKVNINSSFCQLTCSGGVDSVDYTATADLEETQNFIGQFVDFGGYKLKGKATESGHITFKDGVLDASGQAKIENFVVSDTGKQPATATLIQIPFDIQFDTDKEIIKIRSMAVDSDFGKVSLNNSLIPLAEGKKDDLALDVKVNVDLAAARNFILLAADIPQDIDLGGRVDSQLSVNSKRGTYHITTDRTVIENLKIGKSGQEPFIEKLMKIQADILCNPKDKSIAINDLRVEGSQINITKGKFQKTSSRGKTKLTGELTAEYDLAGISKAASAFIPEGLAMEGKRKDSVTLESIYPQNDPDKMMANMNASMNFGFDSAEYMGLNFGPVDMDLKVTNGLLNIAPFSTTVNDGKLNFGGSVDFNEKPSLLKTPKPMQIADKININDKTTDKLLKYVNPIFANAVNVTGIADFHCEQLSIPLASANKNDMVATGTIAMEQIHLNSSGLLGQIITFVNEEDPILTILPTKFVLQNGFLSYENMQINVGRSPVNFRGKIGLNNTIDMDVDLPFSYAGKSLRTDSDMSNRVTLPIDGDLNNPQINTSKLIEKNIEKLLDDEIQKQLERIFQ